MFEQDVKNIFSRDKILFYKENFEKKTLDFTLEGWGGTPHITFENLSKLSKVLRTRKINLGETRECVKDQGSYGISSDIYQAIHCWDVSFEWHYDEEEDETDET